MEQLLLAVTRSGAASGESSLEGALPSLVIWEARVGRALPLLRSSRDSLRRRRAGALLRPVASKPQGCTDGGESGESAGL